MPKTLSRDPGYLFISSRPAEGVRNEVSFVLGFPSKDGGEGQASFGNANFALVTKGPAAWVKNAAEDAAFVEAMRRAQTLNVKVRSKKGNELDRPLHARRRRPGARPGAQGVSLTGVDLEECPDGRSRERECPRASAAGWER